MLRRTYLSEQRTFIRFYASHQDIPAAARRIRSALDLRHVIDQTGVAGRILLPELQSGSLDHTDSAPCCLTRLHDLLDQLSADRHAFFRHDARICIFSERFSTADFLHNHCEGCQNFSRGETAHDTGNPLILQLLINFHTCYGADVTGIQECVRTPFQHTVSPVHRLVRCQKREVANPQFHRTFYCKTCRGNSRLEADREKDDICLRVL